MTDRVLPPDLVDFLGRYIAAHPDLVPGQVRMGPADLAALHNRVVAGLNPQTGRLLDGNPGQPTHLLGMQVITDDSLPAGVWRVCAADGTVLRDSRSTNPVGGPQ